MSIGDGRKTYSDSTLKSMTKDELIEIIRCLESNLRNAHETNDIQYENCKRLLSEEKNKILDEVLHTCDIECGLYSGNVKNLTRHVLMRVLEKLKENISMNEEIKNDEVEEVNPVDEYLNNYKEQKLAEFCVQKDKEIANRKEERQKLMEQISDMKVTVKQHDETWKNMDSLYAKIKELSVNDYLKLYHMMNNDIAGKYSTITTVYPSSVSINGNW